MKTLRELRLDRGLTQQQVGDVMGCTGSAVANYEKGIHSPTVDTLPALAKLLGLKVEEVVAALMFDPFSTVSRETGADRRLVVQIYERLNDIFEAARAPAPTPEPELLRLVAAE